MEKVEKNKNFSKMHHFIVDDRLLAHMSRKDIKVYLVLNRFANYYSGIAFPSVKTIVKLSGVHKNDTCETVEKLEAMGLILTHQGDKEKSFKKYYGIVRRDFIDIESALRVTAKPKRSTKTAVRGKDGRFIPVPKNAEQGSPENADREIPKNTDSAVPQNGTSVSGNAEENKRYEEDKINRDRCIDGENGTSGIEKAKPEVNIREYAAQNGFFNAMKLMYGTGGYKKATDTDDFEKTMEERIRQAKKYYGVN